MTDPEVRLQPAVGPEGLASVERLLERHDLPTEDLRAASVDLRLARVDGETVGAGGVEVHGEYGLLRSVVVEEAARGAGVGTALVEALVGVAGEQGVEDLYLLTTDAGDFFAGRGFEQVDRGTVPAPIRETSQFADLCPSSATVMRRPV